MQQPNSEFQVYQKSLQQACISEPCLFIDEQKLHHNIDLLKQNIGDKPARLVVKSLPSLPLLELVSERLHTKRFLCLHKPFVLAILQHFDDADIMLGKPLPAAAMECIVKTLIDRGDDKKLRQVHWLVDSKARCQQLLMVARKHNVKLSFAIELNVGMHRGGLDNPKELTELVDFVESNRKQLQLSGLMGYDAHVGKAIWPFMNTEEEFEKVNQRYQGFIDVLPEQYDNLILNGGGSTTHMLHANSCCNELSIGSIVLKPADVSGQLLSGYLNAIFIATPVIKRLSGVTIPYLPEVLNNLLYKDFDSVFLYGGLWLAEPVYPRLRVSNLYGRSVNQQLMLIDKQQPLEVDDMVLFIPKRTAPVSLQFGDIIVLASELQKRVKDCWQVMRQGDKLTSKRSKPSYAKQSGDSVNDDVRARDRDSIEPIANSN